MHVIANCTVDPSVGDWGYRYFVTNCITAVCGAFGNVLSLWSIWNDQRTSMGTKINLGTFFGVLLAMCLVSLPWFSYGWYLTLSCMSSEKFLPLRLFFQWIHTTLLPLERINFAAMAVFRLVAVRWPHYYEKIVQVKVIIIMEIVFILYSVTPLIIAVGVKICYGLSSEEQLRDTSSAFNRFHGFENLFPTLVSLSAYIFFIYTIIRHKQETPSSDEASLTTMDQLASTITLIVLVNLLLDVPHIFVHLLTVARVPSLIIHNIYYLHIVIDPIIFVGKNPRYRSELIQRARSCFHGQAENQENTVDMTF